MKLTPRNKKIINIVVDVVVAIILAFALLLTICTISSKAKGYNQYTEIFGKAYLAVASDSMEKNVETGEVGKDNFSKGDLITIKTISREDARKLKVGDIITFRTKFTENGKTVLNSHRIIAINGEEGMASSYRTKGDNNTAADSSPVLVSEIVGVYQGKAGGIGKLFLFMGSSAGFFVCIVLPTLLIVVYCAINLILVIRKEKKVQTADAVQAQLDERERIRQELLAEMQAAQSEKIDTAEPSDTESKPAGGESDEQSAQESASESESEEEKK